MSDLREKVAVSIERLKSFEPPEGYHLAFSGGKDSVVIKALADMAGVKYDSHYRITSVDPPELVMFVKEKHPDVSMDIPRYDDGSPITMWNLIPKKKIPPTRLARYCCQSLKEYSGDGRLTITGVRWAESSNRKKNQGIATVMANVKKIAKENKLVESGNFTSTKRGGVVLVNDNDDSRRMIEQCYKRHKTSLNPIIEWTDKDVWDFIKAESVPYCSLYDEGFKRIGCIGCPLARKYGREVEFARWPKYKEAYIRSFDKMLEVRKKEGKDDSTGNWQSALDVFNWWMEYDILPGQITIEELMADDSDD